MHSHGEKEVDIHLLITMSKIIYLNFVEIIGNPYIKKIIKILKEIDLIQIMHLQDFKITIVGIKEKVKKLKLIFQTYNIQSIVNICYFNLFFSKIQIFISRYETMLQ